MSPLNTPVVPVKMEQARQQLERWRSTRAHRSPIPEPLWALAVQELLTLLRHCTIRARGSRAP
ncbi:MAG: hypothetical protein DMG26_05135 [Acidobacteria bacterium]|nr:MAG: hypothetical protein DMG26_05135 [Acidobacteriota bacterium]